MALPTSRALQHINIMAGGLRGAGPRGCTTVCDPSLSVLAPSVKGIDMAEHKAELSSGGHPVCQVYCLVHLIAPLGTPPVHVQA